MILKLRNSRLCLIAAGGGTPRPALPFIARPLLAIEPVMPNSVLHYYYYLPTQAPRKIGADVCVYGGTPDGMEGR